MSFLQRIAACAVFDAAAYVPFIVAGQAVGLVRHAFAARLAPFSDVFLVSAEAVRLAPDLSDVTERTRRVDSVLRCLAKAGVIAGWRDELYPVSPKPGAGALLEMERAAVPHFGVWAAGIHVNGFVRSGDDLHMWIGRRSPDKHVSPNKLDQLVAGGISAGYSIRQTVTKEAAEEAGITPELAALATPAGAITYCTEREEGLRRDILYVFDLLLPGDFRPVNHDGEIIEFERWPIDRVKETVCNTEHFKFNCALVIIDFLIRHGYIVPDDEPDYLALVRGMGVR